MDWRWYLLMGAAVAIVLTMVIVLVWVIPSTTTATRSTADAIDTADTTPRRYLSTLSIAKNEHMVIEEFIQHYQDQGVDHMFIIDNGSDDNMCALIEPWVQQGFITLFHCPQPHRQTEHYNRVYQAHGGSTEWMLVVDVDEYLFGVHEPLRQVIQQLESSWDYVEIKWTVYGSSGWIKQPPSIRAGFTHRHLDCAVNGKALFKTSLVERLGIHEHEERPLRSLTIDDSAHKQLRLNHYAIMSWEYFEAVKMTRGDAASTINVRDRSYFDNYDQGMTVQDESLKAIAQQGYVTMVRHDPEV